MNIVTVCGMGFGTSLMMKMTIDDILKDENVKAQVDAWDLSSVKGRTADLFVASEDMRSNFSDMEGPIIFIKNMTNTEEIREKVMQAIEEIN